MKAQCKSTTICRCKSIYKHHRLLHRRISPPNDDLKCQSKLDDHNFPKTIDEGETRNESRKPPETPRHDTPTPEGEISQKTRMSSYATMTEERGNHILLHVKIYLVEWKPRRATRRICHDCTRFRSDRLALLCKPLSSINR